MELTAGVAASSSPHFFQRLKELGYANCCGLPDKFNHDPVVLMRCDVLHSGHGLPRHLRESQPRIGGDSLGGFAKHDQVVQHRSDCALVAFELLKSHSADKAGDPLACFEHVSKALRFATRHSEGP